jgi:hypothetical protein
MLKRNGENCEHSVPDYPGLLTASEFQAYQAVIPFVAEQVRLFSERVKLLTDIENQSTQIVEKVAVTQGVPFVGTWENRHSLFKTARGEMALCSRGPDDNKEFGVLERFDPNSAYARSHGESEEIMRGNNAYLVLQNFVESERVVLQLYRQDIKGTVEEKLAELYPNQNLTRVARAVSALCQDKRQVEAEAKEQKTAKSVRIKM